MPTTTWTKAERFDGDGALIAANLNNGARAVIYGDYRLFIIEGVGVVCGVGRVVAG